MAAGLIARFLTSLPKGFSAAKTLGSKGLTAARGAKLSKGTGFFKGLQTRGIAGRDAIQASWKKMVPTPPRGLKGKKLAAWKKANAKRINAGLAQRQAIKNAGIATGIGVGGLAVLNGRNEANATQYPQQYRQA